MKEFNPPMNENKQKWRPTTRIFSFYIVYNFSVLFNCNDAAEVLLLYIFFFFFNDTATTEIYTLSLHDALPIRLHRAGREGVDAHALGGVVGRHRSEEHTSELQSRRDLVCRLLLEKKKKKI